MSENDNRGNSGGQNPQYQQMPYQQMPYQQPPYQQPPYQQPLYQPPSCVPHLYPPAEPKLPGAGVVLAFGIISLIAGFLSVLYTAIFIIDICSDTYRYADGTELIFIITVVFIAAAGAAFGFISFYRAKNFEYRYEMQISREKVGKNMGIVGLCLSVLSLSLVLICMVSLLL